MVLVKTQQ